ILMDIQLPGMEKETTLMAAYVVVDIEVTDPTGFQEDLNVAGPMVAKYGGRLLAAGPAATMLERTWQPKGVTLIQFPTVQPAQQGHQRPRYRPPKQVRRRAAKCNVVLLKGI